MISFTDFSIIKVTVYTLLNIFVSLKILIKKPLVLKLTYAIALIALLLKY
jgi:hypothetical protein